MLDLQALVRGAARVFREIEKTSGDSPAELFLGPDDGDAVTEELAWSARIPGGALTDLTSTLGTDGLWSDIDYGSDDDSVWDSARHLKRMVALARLPKSEARDAAVHKALAGWLSAERVNPNWWWNDIGCPRALGMFALFFGDELSARERRAVLKRMPVVRPDSWTGQNRVWLAECRLLRGLLAGDWKTVAAAREALVETVVVRDGEEGVQSDWSFYQHGRMPQFGNYGISYLLVLSRWAAVFAAAGCGFDAERLKVLGGFLSEGLRRFEWKGRLDVGALGRRFAPGGLRRRGTAIDLAGRYLSLAGWSPADRGVSAGLSFFGASAMAAYRTGRWMAAVKAETRSICGTEHVNRDNMLGTQLADGALFCYSAGDEYEDMFPVWDWRHVPGITGYDLIGAPWYDDDGRLRPRNRREVFERVGDCGVRFSLERDGLSADTEWRFSEDGVDVSVSNITADADLPVVTTVEQSRAKPNAGWRREGDRIVAFNGGIMYEVPADVRVYIGPRSGDWHRVMGSMPETPVEERVFEIVIPHGVRPQAAGCSWKVRFPADGGVSLSCQAGDSEAVRVNDVTPARLHADVELLQRELERQFAKRYAEMKRTASLRRSLLNLRDQYDLSYRWRDFRKSFYKRVFGRKDD